MSGVMSGVGAEMQFWAAEVLPGKPFKVELSPEFEEDDEARTLELLHITNMAFGPDPKPGKRYTVSIESGDKKAMVGTLIPEKVEQCCMDLIFSEDLVICQSGPTPVHISGYKSISYALPSDIDDDSDEDMMGDPSQADNSSDDEEPPKLVSARKVEKVAGDEAEDSGDDSDDEESGEEEEEEGSDDEEGEENGPLTDAVINKKLQKLFGDTPKGKAARMAVEADLSEDDDDEDDSDYDGEEDGSEDGMDAALDMEQGDDDSDEEEEEDGDDDSDDSSDDDDEEEEEKEEPPRKRAAPQAQTPTAKKAKAEPKSKTPSKTSAKIPAKAPAIATPSSAKEYEGALIDLIKGSEKPVGLSEIGSKIKKPAGVSKLKDFLSTRPTVFKMDSDMRVSLA